jgi:hypothetical protein
MNKNKERIKILNDVRRGEMEIPKAINRLQELSARPELPEVGRQHNQLNRELRFVRTDIETDTVLMDLRLPVSLVDAAERVGAIFEPYLKYVQSERLTYGLANPGTHKLVDTILVDKGEHLEIFLD